MRIISIDPGGASGFASYDTQTGIFRCWEESGFSLAAGCLEREICEKGADIVVCERYTITMRTAQLSQQTEALRLTGVAEFLCLKMQIDAPFMQTPGEAKAFATDDKLKKLGWFVRTKDGHSADASRHLLLWLIRNKFLPPEEMEKLF